MLSVQLIPSSITEVIVSSDIATVNATSQAVLNAVVLGTVGFNNAVNWSIISGSGTLLPMAGSSITFTAPSLPVSSTTIIRATSVQDPNKSDKISLSIAASGVVAINISTNLVNLREGDSTVLQGIVSGTSNTDQTLNWTIEENGVSSLLNDNGSLSSNIGNTVSYTAPPSSFGKVVRVTATLPQDPSVTKTIFLGIHPNKQSIGAGGNHSLAVKSNVGVLAWGRDSDGQLGDGLSTINRATPVTVSTATILVAVSAGANHSLALKSDGTMLAWGKDSDGQLGDGGTSTKQATPVAVLNATGIVAISAGGSHSLALRSDGTMLSWGSDVAGQLGDGGTTTNQTTPVAVSNATGIVAISAGANHSLALKANGDVLAWGSDGFEQLGNVEITTNQSTPVAVSNATSVVAISAGSIHSLVLKSDGTLLSWGNDGSGQLGDGGTNTSQTTPVAVFNATGIVAISAGANHSLALKDNGTMLAWGSDIGGQLGNDVTKVNKSIPVVVSSATGIVSISAGGNHSLALKSDGTMLAWGNDVAGQLGDNATLSIQAIPVSVLLGAGITIRLP